MADSTKTARIWRCLFWLPTPLICLLSGYGAPAFAKLAPVGSAQIRYVCFSSIRYCHVWVHSILRAVFLVVFISYFLMLLISKLLYSPYWVYVYMFLLYEKGAALRSAQPLHECSSSALWAHASGACFLQSRSREQFLVLAIIMSGGSCSSILYSTELCEIELHKNYLNPAVTANE